MLGSVIAGYPGREKQRYKKSNVCFNLWKIPFSFLFGVLQIIGGRWEIGSQSLHPSEFIDGYVKMKDKIYISIIRL